MGGKAKYQQSKTLTELTKINKNQSETAKQRIALTKLVDRVQDCVLAKPTDDDYENKQLTPVQLAGAKLLIERLIPATRHETIETTNNINYTISDSVSDKINQLLARANEKVISHQKQESIDDKSSLFGAINTDKIALMTSQAFTTEANVIDAEESDEDATSAYQFPDDKLVSTNTTEQQTEVDNNAI